MTKTVALTFDYWTDAFTVAYPLMLARGLVGTYFVDHRYIDEIGGPTRDHLTQLKMEGWTIGAYSGDDMVAKFTNDRNDAMDFLRDIKRGFEAYGFNALSLAPNGRSWDYRLRNVSVGLFDRVRVANMDAVQTLPFADPLYIENGGVPSLDNGDTAVSLNQRVDDILAGPDGLWTFTTHKIGSNTQPYTVDLMAFTALLDRIEAERDAGTTNVVGYDDLGRA